MDSLVEDNIACLEQGIELLSRLDDGAYTQPVKECFSSTIGGHIRHNVDHYYSFVKGLETGKIDYDARLRDTVVETQPARALESLRDLIDSLKGMQDGRLSDSVSVIMDSGSTHLEDDGASQSTFRRELQFLLSHTVHHFALIAVMAKVLNVEVDAQFGVAPSTIKYREGLKDQCAQ